MTLLNVVLGALFDGLLWPFRLLPPVAGLSVVSLATAAAMLLVVKRTSNQTGIADARRAMLAALFEIRLFNDDLSAVFRALGSMLKQNLIYLRHSLVPLAWLLVPMAFIVAQLDAFYGYTGVKPGEPLLIKAIVTPATGRLDAQLEAPPQIKVVSPAVWLPAAHEVLWRVSADTPGQYVLTARIDGAGITKTLDATDRVVRRSPLRPAAGWTSEFLNPSERPLPEGSNVVAVAVPYEARSVRLLGWDVPWLAGYFALSVAFALLLRKPLGVAL